MDKIQPTIDIHGTKRCYQNGVPSPSKKNS